MAVATSELVYTVMAAVGASAAADEPSTSPDLTESGNNVPDTICTNATEVVTSKRLNEVRIVAQTAAQSVIANLAASIDPDPVPPDSSEQSNSPSRATRQAESNVKAVTAEPENVSESDAPGTDAVVEENADDVMKDEVADSDEGGDEVALITVDDEKVLSTALARGKEYPASSISDVEADELYFLGLLPWAWRNHLAC